MGREKMVERIRALRALANNNPSEEEAKAAEAMAAKLMEEHGITDADVAEPEMPEPGAPWTPPPPPPSQPTAPARQGGGFLDDPVVKSALIGTGVVLGSHYLKTHFGVDVPAAIAGAYDEMVAKAKTEEEKQALKAVMLEMKAYFGGALALLLALALTTCSLIVPEGEERGFTAYSDIDIDSDTDADTDSDTDADTDADSDSDTETETETESSSETGSEIDTPTDTDTDTETESETDSETETEVDCDAWYDGADLCWQDPPSPTTMGLAASFSYCTSLGVGWRLPTIDELLGLVEGCDQSACELSDPSCLDATCDDACTLCDGFMGPGEDGCYWNAELTECNLTAMGTAIYSRSSSTYSSTLSWVVRFRYGGPGTINNSSAAGVRCVKEVVL